MLEALLQWIADFRKPKMNNILSELQSAADQLSTLETVNKEKIIKKQEKQKTLAEEEANLKAEAEKAERVKANIDNLIS